MASHDEFRIKVQTKHPSQLLDALRQASVPERERELLGRVATTHEDDHVFVYCDSQDAAEAVSDAVKRTLDSSGIEGALTVWRWHPLEERWEDPSKPLPSTEAQRDDELESIAPREDAESLAAGYPEWEVRVSLPSHSDAKQLAERLKSEGLTLQRQWRHVILGANDEAQAHKFAERVKGEAPAGTDVVVEGNGMAAWNALHPFSVFGGIAE